MGRGFALGVALGFVAFGAASAGVYVAARPRLRPWIADALREGLQAYGARAQRESRDDTTRLVGVFLATPTGSEVLAGIVAETLDRKLP